MNVVWTGILRRHTEVLGGTEDTQRILLVRHMAAL